MADAENWRTHWTPVSTGNGGRTLPEPHPHPEGKG